jgi:hypothetical protein
MAKSASSFPAKVEKTTYKGWNTYRLTNGLVTLHVAPEIGGRAIQLLLGDQEFFYVNNDLAGKVVPAKQNNIRAGWANYGGDKVWPAPQGWTSDEEWPGPPDYTLEGSRFDSEITSNKSGEVAVKVTSPKDARTGIQFVRSFHVYANTTRINVEQTMRNISKRPIRWSIWHVTQHDAAGVSDSSLPNTDFHLYVPLNPKSQHRGGYYALFGDLHHPSYQRIEGGRMLRIQYLYRAGKVGIDTAAGWFAAVNGQKQIGFVENFTHFPDMEYADQSSLEAWIDGPGKVARDAWNVELADDPSKTPYLMESEVLSPMAALEPGEEYSFPVHWSPTRVPNPVSDANRAGVISEPLTTMVADGHATLHGTFGVFVPGTIEAGFYSAVGDELGHETLQAVDPREVVRVEKTVAIPANAYRVSIRVFDTTGENHGWLGNVVLK